MNGNSPWRIGYDNWWLVAVHVILVGVFVYGLLRPRRRVEWRSAGLVQGWVIALYAEMYGLPLTMYLLAAWTGQAEYVSDHFRGHAWAYLLGWGDWGAVVCDLLGNAMVVAGAVLGLVGWRQIYRGQGGLVCSGLYRRVRHPQYTGFFLFLLGSMVNWPTLIALVLLPVLLVVYYRLACQEETEALARFGDEYRQYQARTGMFWPRWRGS